MSTVESARLDKEKLWNNTLDEIKISVSPAIFSTWLSKTYLLSLKKASEKRYSAEIGCPSAFIKSTVEKRYFGLMQDALSQGVGKHVDLNFIVKALPKKDESSQTAPIFQETNEDEEVQKKAVEARLRPGFTLENFAVSDSNQMAFAAAQAVSKQPGRAYNPLFIWGGVGVGKTHLMHAVGYNLIKRNLNTKIVVCTGEDFTNDIIEGIRHKTTQTVRNKYRKNHALFVDDIQFIAGKDSVQAEFFHTFNTVIGAGGQIILTSDKPPSEIPKLEERLKSRFEAGLLVDIDQPDFELRCAIVQIKAQEKGLQLPTEIVHMIAGNLDTARKIEGVLIRISSEVKLKKTELTENLVQGVLSHGVNGEERKINLTSQDIVETVCKHYSISKRAMMGKGRSRMIARPRQILMYLLRTELQIPYEEVGRLVGGRDHSTAIHAVDRITQLAANDVNIREDILRIKNSI